MHSPLTHIPNCSPCFPLFGTRCFPRAFVAFDNSHSAELSSFLDLSTLCCACTHRFTRSSVVSVMVYPFCASNSFYRLRRATKDVNLKGILSVYRRISNVLQMKILSSAPFALTYISLSLTRLLQRDGYAAPEHRVRGQGPSVPFAVFVVVRSPFESHTRSTAARVARQLGPWFRFRKKGQELCRPPGPLP